MLKIDWKKTGAYFCVASQKRMGRAYEVMKKTLATNGSSGAEIIVEKMQFPRMEMKSSDWLRENP